MQHLDYSFWRFFFFPYSSLKFFPISSLGIAPVTLEVVPAPHPVPPLGPLPPCPAPLPGGDGTRIPPLVLAPGVAPDRGHNLLTDEHSGAEAEC